MMTQTTQAQNSLVLPNFIPYSIRNFDLVTVQIQSDKLKDNPLKDPSLRWTPVLKPKNRGPHPVVFILSGFAGNAPSYVLPKFREASPIQVVDEAVSSGLATNAVYVFVDAMTSWGGSQFINSSAVGAYEDFIIQELWPAILQNFEIEADPKFHCVMGGSSGGYGSLVLAAKHPNIFGAVAAFAPDSFFEVSLLPDMYKALPSWEKLKTGEAVLNELKIGKLMKGKNGFEILNAFAMTACYSPSGSGGNFNFPLENQSGKVIPEYWNQILKQDPLHFLPANIAAVKKWNMVYLDVGRYDEFHLQYGTRQIRDLLKKAEANLTYSEFDGGHFDLGLRRIEIWKWLSQNWT